MMVRSHFVSSFLPSFQAAIVVVFNFAMVLLIFPAILSLDLHRREDKRLDVLCCLYSPCADRVIHLSPHELSDAAEQAPASHARQYAAAGSTITTSTQITTTVQAFTQCDAAGQHIVTILPPTSQISTSPTSIILCPTSQGKRTQVLTVRCCFRNHDLLTRTDVTIAFRPSSYHADAHYPRPGSL